MTNGLITLCFSELKNESKMDDPLLDDGGTATTKITPMPLFGRTCITTADGDRKQPTANQTILWFCDTKKQSPRAVSVARCFLRPEKTRKQQNSFAFHLHETRLPATMSVRPVLACRNFWRSDETHHKPKLLENALLVGPVLCCKNNSF